MASFLGGRVVVGGAVVGVVGVAAETACAGEAVFRSAGLGGFAFEAVGNETSTPRPDENVPSEREVFASWACATRSYDPWNPPTPSAAPSDPRRAGRSSGTARGSSEWKPIAVPNGRCFPLDREVGAELRHARVSLGSPVRRVWKSFDLIRRLRAPLSAR